MTHECVRSGYCCKKAPCPFGEAGPDGACIFLKEDGHIGQHTTYRCERYDFILTQPGAELSPAFGAGCCSPLNSDHVGIMRALKAGEKVQPLEKCEECGSDELWEDVMHQHYVCNACGAVH
jgi:hypothetical protein